MHEGSNTLAATYSCDNSPEPVSTASVEVIRVFSSESTEGAGGTAGDTASTGHEITPLSSPSINEPPPPAIPQLSEPEVAGSCPPGSYLDPDTNNCVPFVGYEGDDGDGGDEGDEGDGGDGGTFE